MDEPLDRLERFWGNGFDGWSILQEDTYLDFSSNLGQETCYSWILLCWIEWNIITDSCMHECMNNECIINFFEWNLVKFHRNSVEYALQHLRNIAVLQRKPIVDYIFMFLFPSRIRSFWMSGNCWCNRAQILLLSTHGSVITFLSLCAGDSDIIKETRI